MDDTDVEIAARDTCYQGYFRIDRYRFRHRLHGGGWSGEITRELFERGHAVAVLPYDPQADAVVLIEQFRIGAYAAGLPCWQRSEEHTSELQSLMRISYAVFCLKTKKKCHIKVT